MAATLTDPLLGHLVDGRYEVLSRIARGGMATVYLAVDRRLDREIALKVMHPHLAEGGTGAEFVARFRREARSAARLTHPGLVGVLDQGVDGQTSYLAMEYVDGTDLRRRLQDEGALTVGDALGTVEAVLDALAAAHRAGLVHRDIKPENVLLAVDGRVKVADFGLARAVTEVTATTTGTVLGTVAYLAPELVAHGTSDTRTDVYAVGILLYEMLTGRQPFTGSTPIQIAFQHVNTDIPAPSDVVPWLPQELDELVAALAAREPADRPAEAAAALALLRRTRDALDPATLARRADVAARPAPVPSPALPADDDREPDPDDHAPFDPQATTALDVADRRRADDARGDGLARTMALQIGTGLAPRGPHGDASAAPEATAADATPGGATPVRDRRRRGAVVALLVGLLLALGGAGAWWFTTYGPGAFTTVPDGVVGAPLADAEAALAAAGLDAAPEEAFDPAVPPGVVVSASPEEGGRVPEEGTVELVVSKGPDLREIPAVVELPYAEAEAALVAAGFVLGEPVREHHDTIPAEHVLAAASAAGPAEPGATLPAGTEVTLTVSDGPAPLVVSSVVGILRDEAVALLQGQGLVVAEVPDFSVDHPAGTVMAQSPEPNAAGLRGDTVTITISQGPPLVAVPEVFGLQFAEARDQLVALGFEVARNNVLGGIFGTVHSQDVAPGTQLPVGSTITLTVV